MKFRDYVLASSFVVAVISLFSGSAGRAVWPLFVMTAPVATAFVLWAIWRLVFALGCEMWVGLSLTVALFFISFETYGFLMLPHVVLNLIFSLVWIVPPLVILTPAAFWELSRKAKILGNAGLALEQR